MVNFRIFVLYLIIIMKSEIWIIIHFKVRSWNNVMRCVFCAFCYVLIDSGNGLVPAGNRSLPGPMLTKVQRCVTRVHWGHVTALAIIGTTIPVLYHLVQFPVSHVRDSSLWHKYAIYSRLKLRCAVHCTNIDPKATHRLFVGHACPWSQK